MKLGTDRASWSTPTCPLVQQAQALYQRIGQLTETWRQLKLQRAQRENRNGRRAVDQQRLKNQLVRSVIGPSVSTNQRPCLRVFLVLTFET